MKNMEKMVCLVDGEHYLPVTKSAIDVLNNLDNVEVVAIVFIGGTEKLIKDDPEDYAKMIGMPVHFGSDKNEIPYELIIEMIREYDADVVMDLSDEPILDYFKRFKIASNVISEGATYRGPDFEFKPLIEYDISKKPSLKILGTGKRTGKTAVSAFASRLIDENGYEPCVVAMGRGGPEEPEIVRGDKIKITPEFLMEQSAKGVHAASDHWEDALMSRILTIGCRRCGGGMSGDVFITNMKKGAEIANDTESKFIIFEGSGAAIPPIKTDKHITLIGANQPLINITNFFVPYRTHLADLVILTMCEEPMTNNKKIKDIEQFISTINPSAKIISTVFRPRPLEDINNKNVLFATTAPDEIKNVLVNHLEENYGCNIVGTTSNLSNRPLLQKDIEKYIDHADMILTELKAAAVDVVTKDSLAAGLEVIYCDNVPIVIDDSYPDLEETILEVVNEAIEDFNKKK
jgi:cyclic 2,3-diphosphoglycerate synthetase